MEDPQKTTDKRKAEESLGPGGTMGNPNDSCSDVEIEQPLKKARMMTTEEPSVPLSTAEMNQLLSEEEEEEGEGVNNSSMEIEPGQGSTSSKKVEGSNTEEHKEILQNSQNGSNGNGKEHHEERGGVIAEINENERNGQIMEFEEEINKNLPSNEVVGPVPATSNGDHEQLNAGSSGETTQTTRNSSLPSSFMNMDNVHSPSGEINISLSAFDPKSGKMVYHEPSIKSNYMHLETFLNLHHLSVTRSSFRISSGYAADKDTNSEDTFSSLNSSFLPIPEVPVPIKKNRWTSSTLGSCIPRESIKTIISEDGVESPETSKERGKNEPKITSTKIYKTKDSSKANLSNGGSGSPNGVEASKVNKKRSSTSSRTSGGGKQKKSTTTSSTSTSDKVVKKGSNPASSKPKTPKPRTVSREFSGILEGKASTPVVEPSPARAVAIVEGTSAKPLTKFEQEVNNEPVVIEKLEHSKTLWGSISPNNPVFARWSDKNYYSGIVKEKGLNDTWIIDFDDATTYPASEGHIIPINILGVGIKGVYCPDTGYHPADAIVLGQKFDTDPEIGETVKYAIKLTKGENSGETLWCTRRMLSIKESDARILRQEFQPAQKMLKAAEVSLENIIPENHRRRTASSITKTQTPISTPQSASKEKRKEKKLLGGAFDSSTTTNDTGYESKNTPSLKHVTPKTPRRDTPKQKPMKKNVSKILNSTPISKSSGKDGSLNASLDSSNEKAVRESPKKKKDKQEGHLLFDGYQFFLTASGGGDPASLGSSGQTHGYDKDEYRDIIEGMGGKVIDGVGKEKGRDKVILISDNYARTVKYIYCLAASIPCVSYKWVQDCMAKNKIVSWKQHELNAGYSIEEERVITPHKEKPLKDFGIFITAGSGDLYNYWKPVLTAAGANLLDALRDKKGKVLEDEIPDEAEVLVTDATCSTEVIAKAHEKMIHVVKPEWLVQSIIAGKKADFFSHDKYRVDIYDDDEEDEEEDQ